MATRNYIYLSLQTGGAPGGDVARFRVVNGSYAKTRDRARSVRYDTEGQPDIVVAANSIKSFQMVLKVPHSPSGDNVWGGLTTLEGLYDSGTKYFLAPDDPGTTNSTIRTVEFGSPMVYQALTPMLDGDNAWFLVPIVLIQYPNDGTVYTGPNLS